jgi:hypothetical protein
MLYTLQGFRLFFARHPTPTTMNTTIKNSLPLTELGFIPSDRAKTFYRVESWNTGSFIADFATQAEAKSFAISDARANGCRYDHKVSTCTLITA